MPNNLTPNCTCERCGKIFRRPPSRAKTTRFCSVECTMNRVERTCEWCGKLFSVPASMIVHHAVKYCGTDCKYKAAVTDPVATIMGRIDRSGGPDACWPYTGTRLPKGYGSHKANHRHWYAHRVAYEQTYGPIADGLEVCHKCDNPPCCNPTHLFLGTHAENMQDKIDKGRHRVTRPIAC